MFLPETTLFNTNAHTIMGGMLLNKELGLLLLDCQQGLSLHLPYSKVNSFRRHLFISTRDDVRLEPIFISPYRTVFG